MSLCFHPRFQSTLPRGERPLCKIRTPPWRTDFNPRSREGSDLPLHLLHFLNQEFQSTLPRGERLLPSPFLCFEKLFQSTLPRGERPRPDFGRSSASEISIHAPARGATFELPDQSFELGNFNPRSREGSDGMIVFTIHSTKDFNPRSREGSDTNGLRLYANNNDFNPRSREGSDYFAPNFFYSVQISIHAPARGATGTEQNNPNGSSISIHAPARGATVRISADFFRPVFQSTLPRGERHLPRAFGFSSF